MIVFFFSSRRRHTRLQGDWSSDVCSSDLGAGSSKIGNSTSCFKMCSMIHVLANVGISGPHSMMRFCISIKDNTSDFMARSEERRVGKEGRSRGAPDHLKKKKTKAIGRVSE